MRTLVCLLAAFFVFATSNGAGATTATDSLHGLDWLAGHTWRAKLPASGTLSHIDVHYDWAETGNLLQFATRFYTTDGKIVQRYAGNFYYDPGESTLMMWYLNSANTIVHGPVTLAGDTMTMTFQSPDDEGKPAEYRVDVTRTTPAAYRWELFKQDAGSWAKQLSLTYERAD
jgi:hypothetical protein